MPADPTTDLLDRWFEGDREALRELVARNWAWVKGKVRERLGDKMRQVGESDDFVQESMLDFMKYSPRFRVRGEGQFRALLARVVESAIRDQNDYWFRARRRALSQECPVSSDTVLDLAVGRRAVTPPDERTAQNEMDALLRLAVEMLGPDDRRVIVLRHWDDREFGEIAQELGITPDGARKRYERALPKLANILRGLKQGDLERAM